MMNRSRSGGGPLVRWSSRLFLVGGVLLAGHAALWGVQLVTDVRPPMGVLAAAGHLVAVVALLLLSPFLAERTPTLARAAAVAATVPAVGWSVVAVEQLVEIAGGLPEGATVLPPAAYVVVLASTVGACVLFAVASVRAGVDARPFSVLLLAPAALLVARFPAQAVLETSAVAGVVTGTGLALALLAIGYGLRTTATDDREAPAGDPVMG